IWLVNELKRMKLKPGVISRGYGGKRKVEPMFVTANANPQASGDEPLLIARKAKVPVAVGKNRYKAAKMLHKDYHVNCLVSDDGMQHYALHRDMEIVMLDAQWQLGNEMMMPAGPLREPKQRLETVDLIIYKGHTDQGHHYTSNIGSIYKLNKPSIKKKVEDFRSQKLYAMAGIANPNSFFSMLSAHGLAVIKKYLSDHHEFTDSDFEYEHDYPILITEKDAVKCEHIDRDNVWVVSLEIEMSTATKRHYRKLIRKVLNNE
ncbi:MAG: tetraacyldisaccharide 4'-kinase, partial [Proteobacteria bacterium]|nr:tetraacyldisaccharide 4'-kinase [Pseudomonadota bacterium]